MTRKPPMATEDDRIAWLEAEAALDRAAATAAIETLREAIGRRQPVGQVAIRLFDLAKIEAFLDGWRG